jgi:uncharacterized protein YnzC (UPF0291/DUF896 family)
MRFDIQKKEPEIGMTKEQIARINELAHKKKTVGLTTGELQEQSELRAQYLKDFREGFKQQLDHTYIQYEDGHREKLTERPPKQ